MDLTRRRAILLGGGLVAGGAVASAGYFGSEFGRGSEITIRVDNRDSVSHKTAIIISDSDGVTDYFSGLADVAAGSTHEFGSGITISEFVPTDIFANVIVDNGASNRFSLDIREASSVTFVITRDGELELDIN